jgi:two-component system, sensor histidine kinase PdtaS
MKSGILYSFRHYVVFLFCIAICVTSSVIAQSSIKPAEDSILQLIEESNDDSLKMEWYNQLRRLTVYDAPEKSLIYVEKFGTLARKLNLDKKFYISRAYYGNTLIALGRYEEALPPLFEAERYFYEKDELVLLSSVFNSIAAVYEQTKRDSLAKMYFEEALQLANNEGDLARKALALNNLANVYFREGNYEKSRDYLEEVLAIKDFPHPDYLLKYKLNYANTLLKLKKLKDAEHIYLEILDNSVDSDNYTLCMTNKGLGSLYNMKKNYRLSSEHLLVAFQMAIAQKFEHEKAEILELLCEALAQQGKYKDAYKYMVNLQAMKDSLMGLEKDKNLIDALTKFDAQKKQQEIQLLEAQNQVKDLQIAKAAQTRWMLLLGLFGALLLAAFTVRMQVIKSRYSKTLESKNNTISKALDEKNILLREIHHRVKNNLQVISSLLKLQSQYIQDETALRALSEGRNRVNSMAILHQNLYKEDNLTGVDMEDYFTQLIEGLFDTYNMDEHRISLETKINSITLDIDTVIPLGLIANELVSNALKHAFQDMEHAILNVSLWETENTLYFMVKDNGVGLSESKADRPAGFGQKLIQALAEKLDAEIEMNSTKGTEVLLRIKDYKKVA